MINAVSQRKVQPGLPDQSAKQAEGHGAGRAVLAPNTVIRSCSHIRFDIA